MIKFLTVDNFKQYTGLLSQLFRFGMVGILSTISHIGTLIFLVEFIKWPPLPSSTLGFILAVLVSYALNYRFTFMARGTHVSYFPKYLVVCIIGLIFNTGIMYFTVSVLGWWYVAGQLCTAIVVPVSNFTLNKFWTFKNMKIQN